MIVRCTSEVPPAMLAALLHSHCRCHLPVERRPRARRRRARDLGQVLGHVGPRQLDPARLRARLLARGRAATACASCAAAARAARRTPAPARRRTSGRRAGRARAAVRVQLGEVHLVHDLLLEREVRAPLVGERRVGHRPPVVQPADEVVVGHEHLVEEHLVELGLAGDLHERPDLDAVGRPCRRRGRRCRGASGASGRCGPGRSPSGRTARRTSTPSGR